MRERSETTKRLPPTDVRAPEPPPRGVNVVGFFEAESGLGEVARRLAAALDSAGVPFAAIPYRDTLGRQGHPHGLPLGEAAPYDTNLICLSADDLARFGAGVGGAFFERRYSIGVWFWETSVFRAEDRAAARYLDELWVASDYVRQSVAAEVEIPVHVVPVPVEPPRGPFRTRTELGLPDAFTFLFVFDYWSGERKNPAAVVGRSSRRSGPARARSSSSRASTDTTGGPSSSQRSPRSPSGREDVLLRDGYVTEDDRDSYVAACDCYVSLHRSEGLGLTLAEAMASGKPVIATGYSGNLEFMREHESLLVPYRLVDVPESWWAHAPGAVWAEPDVGAAARLMRRRLGAARGGARHGPCGTRRDRRALPARSERPPSSPTGWRTRGRVGR